VECKGTAESTNPAFACMDWENRKEKNSENVFTAHAEPRGRLSSDTNHLRHHLKQVAVIIILMDQLI
jgi:hypothetical protein